MDILVTEVQIIPIKPTNGLVAFATCVINKNFYVGNIAVYTSPLAKDGFRLQYPTKKLSSGKQVDCFYPIRKEAGDLVSKVIINKYLELMDNFNHIE